MRALARVVEFMSANFNKQLTLEQLSAVTISRACSEPGSHDRRYASSATCAWTPLGAS
jgi:hypothetical protein